MSFEYPPIYSFPPFFTQQPNEASWAKQQDLWSSLIIDWFKANDKWELTIGPEAIRTEPFCNTQIDRRLSEETLSRLVEGMVLTGHAEWLVKGKKALIFWRRPAEWADSLYNWARERGMIGTIVTAYELFESDDAKGEPFHGLPEPMWQRVISNLEKEGKAKAFSQEDGAVSSETGIKFF